MHAGDAEPSASPRAQGIEHFRRNDYPQALACFDSSLSMHPGDRELYNYKARALEGVGRFAESLTCIDRCLELDPNNVAELCNRALMLAKLSRRDEALATFDRVLEIQPNHVDVLVKRAFLLHQIDRRDDALISAHRAVSLAPADLNALNTRGMLLDDMGRRDEALVDFQAILAIDPGYSDAITNRGIMYGRSGQFREALACYDQSLSLNPHQPNAFYNCAVVRLVLGDWSQGFRDFESRWKLFPHEAARLTRLAPRWSGQRNVAGKSILLHHEQGFGDTLQFCRYIPLVMQLGARVVVATPTGLRRLLSTLPGSPQIVSEGEPVPAHDYHCPLMSLPLAFGTTPSTVPAQIPYLRADRDEVRCWAERLGERKRLRLGVVWSGRRFPPINHARDMTLDAIRPLFALNADFICLHTELSDAERAELTTLPNVAWWGDQLGDFADTAALVENLDVVITVDSAVAHLAGALGKPVWLLNRYASCWRWLLERHDSPWYPSLRLFRQPALGDWASVVRDVLRAGLLVTGGQTVPRKASGSSAIGASSAPAPDLANLLQRALDLHNGGELTEAIAAYGRIMERFPDQFDTLHYLGVALAQMRRFEEALVPLGRAIEIRPESAVAHNHYGNALAGLSRHTEAIQSYERATRCDGGFADSHYHLGVAYSALGQREAALDCYTQATELNPGYAQALNNRGILLAELNRVPEALADYERAIKARPDFVDAWANRSYLLRRLHRYEEALECSERALKLDPKHPEAHNSRGATFADLGRYDEAMASYERAIELNPSSAEALWNKGLIELTRGELRKGWKHYESRWGVKTLKLTQRFPGIPPWQGESVNGKSILLHTEQGYGDMIQFSRFCSEIAALGARVIVSAPEALRSLFESLHGIHEVIGPTTVPAFDFHCPLMSAPLALGTELENIPAPVRYLHANSTAKAQWADRLRARKHSSAVGLVWSGRNTHSKDRERSIPLQQFLPLLRDTVQWVSLQKEIRASDEAYLVNTPAILRMGEELDDFADAAALVENLDLVITVDTAVAHLAGALGKPVWILLPYVADWRWLQNREDSPWYPTARLFRQSARRDWGEVIDRVGVELRKAHLPDASKDGKATRPSRARLRKK